MRHLFNKHSFSTVFLWTISLAAGIFGWARQFIAGDDLATSLFAGLIFAGAAALLGIGLITLAVGGGGGGSFRQRSYRQSSTSEFSGGGDTFDTDRIASSREMRVLETEEGLRNEGAYRTRAREQGLGEGVPSYLSPRDRVIADSGDVSKINTKSVVFSRGGWRPCFPIGLPGTSSADVTDGTTPKRVVRDGMLYSDPDLPVGCLIGATGSGKSTSLTIPAILGWGVHCHPEVSNYYDDAGKCITPVGQAAFYNRKYGTANVQYGFPLVVLSPKPDLLSATYRARRAQGPTFVLTIDGYLPNSPADRKEQITWTPLREVDSFEDARRVAASLARSIQIGSENAFFEASATSVLTASLLATYLVDRLRDCWVETEARQAEYIVPGSGVTSVLQQDAIENLVKKTPDHEGIERVADIRAWEATLRTCFELCTFSPDHAPKFIMDILLAVKDCLESLPDDHDVFTSRGERQQLITGVRSARSLISEAADATRGLDTTSSILATISACSLNLSSCAPHPVTGRNIFDTLREESITVKSLLLPVRIDGEYTSQVPTLYICAGSVSGAEENQAITGSFMEALLRAAEMQAGKQPDQRVVPGSLGIIIDETSRMLPSVSWLSSKLNTARSMGVSFHISYQNLYPQCQAEQGGTENDAHAVADALQPVIVLSGSRHSESLQRYNLAAGQSVRDMANQVSTSESKGWNQGSSQSSNERSRQDGSSGSTTTSYSRSREIVDNFSLSRLSGLPKHEAMCLFQYNVAAHVVTVPYYLSPYYMALAQHGPGGPGTKDWSVTMMDDLDEGLR